MSGLIPSMASKPEELLQSIMTHFQKFTEKWKPLMKIIEDCLKDLLGIADDVDKFHKGATIASVTGSTFGILGGITTIVGLALAPVTLGVSLIVSGVGIGVAVAGGVTGATASIVDTVNIKKKCNRVEEIVLEINRNLTIIRKISEIIERELEALRSILGVQKNPQLMHSIRGRGTFLALEIGRLVQLGRVSAAATRGVQLVAQGAQAARAVSGVFAAVFIVVDAAFVVKGAIDLHKGAKTEAAAEIRKIAHNLQKTFDDLKEEDKILHMGQARLLTEKWNVL